MPEDRKSQGLRRRAWLLENHTQTLICLRSGQRLRRPAGSRRYGIVGRIRSWCYRGNRARWVHVRGDAAGAAWSQHRAFASAPGHHVPARYRRRAYELYAHQDEPRSVNFTRFLTENSTVKQTLSLTRQPTTQWSKNPRGY